MISHRKFGELKKIVYIDVYLNKSYEKITSYYFLFTKL